MADNRQSETSHKGSSQIPTAASSTNLSSHQRDAPYLDQTQQSLLLAALNSQNPRSQAALGSSEQINKIASYGTRYSSQPQESDVPIKMDTLDNNFTPELLDFDDSFDFENADLGGQMIGALDHEEDDGSYGAEQHEKRKNPDDTEAGDAKRQETGPEKGAKKPGRKPLTSEPTTKRKAQNRAAQRAFRERKEAHLKDLETKVSELTKTSEADKHENGLLKAQVDRLQTELREYRKRLSLNSSGIKRSPQLSATQPSNQMGFQFDFPKFGSLPTASLLGGSMPNTTPPLSTHSPVSTNLNSQSGQPSRHNSEGRSMSPTTKPQISQTRNLSRMSSLDPTIAGSLLPYSTSDNMHGFASTLPQMGKNGNDPFGDLFSPSILKSVNSGADGNYFNQNAVNEPASYNTNGGDSTAGIPDNRVFRFNSQSVGSDSASPSMSSLSQGHTANSSCGTSPEPVNDSPGTKLKSMESTDGTNNAQYSFTQLPNQTNDLNFANLDSFNVPQVDTFDPVLYGDYRDTNDNIVGDGSFNNGFFDDSYNSSLDFGSPSNLFGILSPSSGQQISAAPTPSRNLMAECDKARDGGDDDYGLPTTQNSTETPNLISCTKIWNQLQSNPDFKDGKFDLDGLCSELRTKARCSESGLMVDSKHVDDALKRLTQKPPSDARGSLMFEQESWDNVLKKLKAGNQ